MATSGSTGRWRQEWPRRLAVHARSDQPAPALDGGRAGQKTVQITMCGIMLGRRSLLTVAHCPVWALGRAFGRIVVASVKDISMVARQGAWASNAFDGYSCTGASLTNPAEAAWPGVLADRRRVQAVQQVTYNARG